MLISQSKAFSTWADVIHAVAQDKGWWPADGRNDAEIVALIHSEASELLEALRRNNPPSKKIPQYSAAEEEAADIIIRVLDFAAAKGWDIDGAVVAKHEYNKTRPHRHGGKRY